MLLSAEAVLFAETELGDLHSTQRPIGMLLVIPGFPTDDGTQINCRLIAVPRAEGLVQSTEGDVLRQTRELLLEMSKLPGAKLTTEEGADVLFTFAAAFRFLKRINASQARIGKAVVK